MNKKQPAKNKPRRGATTPEDVRRARRAAAAKNSAYRKARGLE